jgi:hypothetical protein
MELIVLQKNERKKYKNKFEKILSVNSVKYIYLHFQFGIAFFARKKKLYRIMPKSVCGGRGNKTTENNYCSDRNRSDAEHNRK